MKTKALMVLFLVALAGCAAKKQQVIQQATEECNQARDAALRAAQTALADILAKGHQRDQLGQMLTRAELYELLDYAGYEERDRSYFG